MKLFIPFVFILLIFTANSQNAYRVQSYSLNQGLSQSVVTTIIQDNIGTLWIGTQDGLNRFDGQTFENFSSENVAAIKNDFFYSALKGKDKKLWFGTGNGLICYNPVSERFINYSPSSSSALQVQCLTEDAQGNIWIGSINSGIHFLKKGNAVIQKMNYNLPSGKILLLYFENPDTLLVSTDDAGLYRLNIRTGAINKISYHSGKKEIRANVIRQLNDHSHIIGTSSGLFQLRFGAAEAVQFLPTFHTRFGETEISDINVVSENTMFISTFSQGVVVAVKDDHYQVKYSQLIHDRFNTNSIPDNNINVLFKDKSATYWMGTTKGLCSFDPFNAGFYGISTSQNIAYGLSSPNVWSFEEDPLLKYLYIGTDNAISRLDKKTGRFDHYYLYKENAQETNETSVLCLKQVKDNLLLAGTTNGLRLLNIKESGYSYEAVDLSKIKNSAHHERIYTLLHWKGNQYFVGTKAGILLVDIVTKEVLPFDGSKPEKAIAYTGDACRYIYRDRKGNILFAAGNGGVYILKDRNGTLAVEPSIYNSLILSQTKDYITTIRQVDENTYWMGTMGSGIVVLDTEKKQARVYNKKNGLPNKVVYGILVDQHQGLWFSTNKGLSNFSKGYIFQNYTEMDGLMSNEFNQGAYFQSKTGEFFFGGINGYNFFRPENLTNIEKNISVSFTRLKLDGDWLVPDKGKQSVLKQSISMSNQLHLGYKQRSFTLMIMANDLSNPKLVSYKYTLEGTDEGEVFLGSFNQIHFTNLSPGSYTLKVYAKLGNGSWSSVPKELDIYIAAPFWRTWWFWISAGFVIALAIYIYIRKKIENGRREQVRLEMKIAERTQEIRKQKSEIELQNKTIEEKNSKLEEQKQLLEHEKVRTEKLLRNIIPESTYEELKTKGRASARAYTTVSVMFTDFVGFTKISEKMTPTEIVNELDIYFRKFDEIIVANNLEKIKTIGDAYMCAGGVPVRNNTNPIDTCLAALQIQESMRQMREEARKEGRIIWDLRLGINTGEVTAGVIGSKKLAYDIWGSTVNKAHRMEMLGEPNKVTVSGETFKYIEPYFVCTFKGRAKSKSKELINMYSVESIKPELSVDGKGIYPNQKFKEIVNLHFYSSINYYKAERHIIRELEKRLSPKLHYHSISHTKDVCDAIERLALSEGITDEGLFLLKSAATYHDAGFVEKYEKNEEIGARMAEEILPQYGYSPEHIERIKELIYVTQIPHRPQNHLEEIMCDADLDYLGRSDFHEIADKLRQELRDYGKLNSDREWDEIQVKFLTAHTFFTKTAKESRNIKKAQNLQEIKERLSRDEYKD